MTSEEVTSAISEVERILLRSGISLSGSKNMEAEDGHSQQVKAGISHASFGPTDHAPANKGLHICQKTTLIFFDIKSFLNLL